MALSISANDISNTVLFDINECCVWLIARLQADVRIDADIGCAALAGTNFALVIFRQSGGAIMWLIADEELDCCPTLFAAIVNDFTGFASFCLNLSTNLLPNTDVVCQ